MSFLETKTMYLSREKNQSPTISISGDIFLKVKIRQAFPLSFEGKFITIFDSDDQYLGTIRDPESCDTETLSIIQEELDWRYYRPQITRIIAMDTRGGNSWVSVETSHGSTLIEMRDLREGMVELSPGFILMTDKDGNRFEISSLENLDKRSRRLINRLI